MKNPEEIAKALHLCYNPPSSCNDCPYGDCKDCVSTVAKDAEEYIRAVVDKLPRWIPVEERLPDCRVLAINDRGVVAVGKIGKFYDRGENVYVCDEWDSNIGIIHVTHWMPLPEPPEEVQHEP